VAVVVGFFAAPTLRVSGGFLPADFLGNLALGFRAVVRLALATRRITRFFVVRFVPEVPGFLTFGAATFRFAILVRFALGLVFGAGLAVETLDCRLVALVRVKRRAVRTTFFLDGAFLRAALDLVAVLRPETAVFLFVPDDARFM